MTAAEFNQLSDLEQDRAALAALRLVLDTTPRGSLHSAGLVHAFAVMSVRISAAEQELRREVRTA